MGDKPAIRCRARSKKTGNQCGAYAVHGATVCRHHGGSAPQVKAKAAQRVAEQQLTAALAQLDVPAIDNPLVALTQLAGQIVAFKDQLAERVNQLHAIRYTDGKGGEQLRSEVALFERALDRTVNVLAVIAKLNIDERLAKISEQQAGLVRDVVMGSLTDAGVEPEVQRDVAGHFTRRLRLVAG